MKRLIALAAPLSLTLTLAACGGDDDGGAGGSTEAWCALAVELDEQEGLDEMDVFDPDSVREAYGEFRSSVERARSAAPAEIRADIDTLADGIERVDEALSDVDYNFLDLDLAIVDELNAEMEAASDRVDRFNERECGIESSAPTSPDLDGDTDGDVDGDTDGDTSGDFGSGTARDLIVTELTSAGFTEAEASCIVDNLDLTDMGQFEENPMAMLEVFETCDISFERLAEFGG